MINEKKIFNEFEDEPSREYDSTFDTSISRLKSTLVNRLKLVNAFEKLINKNHIPLTLFNINVDIENEESISNYLLKNTEYIQSNLGVLVKDYIVKNGSEFQKSRISSES